MAKLKDLALKGAGDRLLFDLALIYEKEGYNTRDMGSPEVQAHIRRMADAIKANGTEAFPEITVFQEGDRVFVHRGHCRLRAHKLAKDEGAPVLGIRVIAAPKQDDAERALDILASNDGLPLTPLEKAAAVKRLLKFEWTPADIAKARGCSVTAITDLIRLLDAPEEVKGMVQRGEVAARTATDVIRKEGGEQGTKTLQKAVETAKEAGKAKATAKHLPKTEKSAVSPAPVNTKPAATHAVPKASSGINYENWGPKMKKLLEKLRDVENIAELQSLQAQVGPFLTGMVNKPGGV